MEIEKKKNINVFLVGLAFLLLFTAFQTMGNIQTVLIENAMKPGHDGFVEGFKGDGFISLGIIYLVSAIFNWLAPSAMVILGLKLTMIIGAGTYVLFIATFFLLMEELLYTGSALLGVGAALIWTAQGTFLTVNSNSETMSRNSGIFWAMLQSSLLIGNTFAFFQFQDTGDITSNQRTVFVAGLFGVGCLGFLTFFTFLPTPWAKEQLGNSMESPLKALKSSFSLFKSKEMLQLLCYFFYMGMELTFWSGVYGPCLGFTMSFVDPTPKSMNGLHGIFIGVGEILAGLIFGIFGHVTNRLGRWPVVVLGTVLQFLAFILIFLNIPNDAPFDETTADAFIVPSNAGLAIFCSFLLGFGDACYNTQTLSLLGGIYPDRAGPAFAIFKFIQCIAAAAGFGYAGFIPLYWHIGMMWVMGTIGTLFFVKIDIQTSRKEGKRKMMLEKEEDNKATEDHILRAEIPASSGKAATD